MRILIENGGYRFLNTGDVAMLDVAVSRLSQLWPNASIGVISDAPERLGRCCPTATHVPAAGRRQWFEGGFVQMLLPRLVRPRGHTVERRWRRFEPRSAGLLLRARARLRGEDTDALRTFLEWLENADLLVVSGAGGMNDAFGDHALTVLEEIEVTARRGIPTVMLGQGIGPIRGPGLRRRAMEVLPRVDLIGLREERAGLPLLRSLGVANHRIVTTGDDAIELAFDEGEQVPLGAGIGVNVRVAGYSGTDEEILHRLRPVLHTAAAQRAAPLVPLPISYHPADSDVAALETLLGSSSPSYRPLEPDDVAGLVARVSDCRVVVTGSYHAGLFALCRGIPIVGLAQSRYYVDKFLGLADQFGVGVSLVVLDHDDAMGEVRARLHDAWEAADDLRPRLLAAAARQLERGRHAYRQLDELCARSGQPARVTGDGRTGARSGSEGPRL